MEKPRMDAGRRLYRTGLLMYKKIFLMLIIILIIISYGWGQSGSKVYVTVYPEILITEEVFTVAFLVDYPAPEEVYIISPPFAGVLVLDRFLRTPRFGTEQTQTSLEFRFISYTSGRIILGPFSVVTPIGTTEIEAVVLNIRSEKGEQIFTQSFRWEGERQAIPPRIIAGERVTLILRKQQDNNISQAEKPSSFFMPDVPQGVILSQSQISAQERERGIVLKLTLIPLTGGEFFLPARILQLENWRFEIPELRIIVNNR